MPELAADITPEELEKDVRDELRSLPNDLADKIACHLVAAQRALGDVDATLAYEHAKVARRFAARIGVVREVVGLAAYRAGQYAEALSDLRAARRLTGSDEFLPIMADCERGLGRPERALDLVRSPEAERLDRAGRIELAIVESGARRDLGQNDAAVITLQRVPELRNQEPHPWSARLAFAYADALAEAGHESAAADWFERAMMFDEDGETDAAERYAQLTGAVIEDIEEDEDDEDLHVDIDDLDVAGARQPLDDVLEPAGTGSAIYDPEVVESGSDAGPAEPTAPEYGAGHLEPVGRESDPGDLDLLARDSSAGDHDVVARESAAGDLDPLGRGSDADAFEPIGEEADTGDAGSAAELAGQELSEPASPERIEPGDRDEAKGGGDLGADLDPEPVAQDSIGLPVSDDRPEAASPGSGTSAAPTAKPELKNARLEPGMAPAFIEPDFGVSTGGIPGDVLDEDLDDENPGRRSLRDD
jgi:tetratricopeptide (TPR) repeat protein